MHVGMLGKKLCDRFGLMSGEIIQDHVDLFIPGLVSHELSEEGDELGGGVVGGGLAQYFSGFGVEGGVQGERAMWGGSDITDGFEFVISVLGLCSVSSRIPAVKDSPRTSVCDAGYTIPRSR